MNDKIVVFRGSDELDAEANLREYIRVARDEMTALGADLPFDENIWDVTRYMVKPGHTGTRKRLLFRQFDDTHRNSFVPMREPFVTFAKSYVRHEHALSPTRVVDSRLAALRALETALAESRARPNVVNANSSVFNRAAQLLQEKKGEQFAYQAGRELERISARLAEHGLATLRMPWKSNIQAPVRTTGRIGEEFNRLREKHMPSQAALGALPQIYRDAKEPGHIIASSVMAVLLCAPSRISEALSLPVHCEHRTARDGKESYGLRWWPAKGARPMIKPVLPSMRWLAEEALEKIRKVTEPARELARWYEKHPGKLYLPPELEYLREREEITMREVSAIQGTPYVATGKKWCRRHGLTQVKHTGRWWVRFEDVERAVIKELPAGFPVLPGTGVKYENALMVARLGELNVRNYTSPCRFVAVSSSAIMDLLGAHHGKGQHCIFSDHGFKEPDGSAIRLRTHQLRHYLNTLAQRDPLEPIDLAMWSARTDVEQNEKYDHESADELLTRIRDAIGDPDKMKGSLADLPKSLPISWDEFRRKRILNALTTDTGYCTHEYTMVHCPWHSHCIDCEDHLYQKTPKTRAAIQRLCDEAETQIGNAERAGNQGYAGANRWLDKHRATFARLQQVRAIMEDPTIDGTFFQIPPTGIPGPSQ